MDWRLCLGACRRRLAARKRSLCSRPILRVVTAAYSAPPLAICTKWAGLSAARKPDTSNRKSSSCGMAGIRSNFYAQDAYSLELRAGAAFDRWLVTANAGVVYATSNIIYPLTGAGPLADWGYTAGVSADYLISDHVFVGAKYDHQFYRNFAGNPTKVDVDTGSLKVGYKFRRPKRAGRVFRPADLSGSSENKRVQPAFFVSSAANNCAAHARLPKKVRYAQAVGSNRLVVGSRLKRPRNLIGHVDELVRRHLRRLPNESGRDA